LFFSLVNALLIFFRSSNRYKSHLSPPCSPVKHLPRFQLVKQGARNCFNSTSPFLVGRISYLMRTNYTHYVRNEIGLYLGDGYNPGGSKPGNTLVDVQYYGPKPKLVCVIKRKCKARFALSLSYERSSLQDSFTFMRMSE